MRSNVIKKLYLDRVNGWDYEKGAYLLVRIDHIHHFIQFEDYDRVAVDFSSLVNFLLTDKDVRNELKWAAEKYKRTNPIFFRYHQGMSGCEDFTLCYSQVRHDWAAGYRRAQKEAFRLHISCANKLNEGIPDFFSGDLLDLLIYLGNEYLIQDLNYASSKVYKKEHYGYRPYVHHECELYSSACGCRS